MKLRTILENVVLIENKKQYMEMFQWFFNNELINVELINDAVDDARKKLQRRDRIIWYLRHLRYLILVHIYENDDSVDPDKLEKRLRKYQTNLDPSIWLEETLPRTIDSFDFLLDLEHFLNLPVPKIQEYEFQGHEGPGEIIDYFRYLERDWKEQFDSVVEILDDHDILIDFGDGFAWWIVGSEGRVKQECEAMGHCGTPANSDSWTTLSLREQKFDDYVEPHATAIVDNLTNNILEFKGKGNEKLAQRYWEYGKELFLHDFIEGVDYSESYMPENDLHPLDVMSLNEILSLEPNLLSDAERAAAQIENGAREPSEVPIILEDFREKHIVTDSSDRLKFNEDVENFGFTIKNRLVKEQESESYFQEQFSYLLYLKSGEYEEEISTLAELVEAPFPQTRDDFLDLVIQLPDSLFDRMKDRFFEDELGSLLKDLNYTEAQHEFEQQETFTGKINLVFSDYEEVIELHDIVIMVDGTFMTPVLAYDEGLEERISRGYFYELMDRLKYSNFEEKSDILSSIFKSNNVKISAKVDFEYILSIDIENFDDDSVERNREADHIIENVLDLVE